MTIGDLLAEIDVPVNVPPHNCIHRSKERAWVSNANQLERRQDFRREFALRIHFSQKKRIEVPCKIVYEIWRKTTRKADASNLWKECEDGLVDAGVLLDDRFVVAIEGRVHQGKDLKPRIKVTVLEDSE